MSQDPRLASLALRDRVWIICERHRVAQRGTVITIGPATITVALPRSMLPPQRYDRATGMHCIGELARSNDFFVRVDLPARYINSTATPPYVTVDLLETDRAAS